MRDLCESADPAAGVAAAKGERIGDLAAILANTVEDSARRDQAVAARADRPAGREGGRRHLRDLAARTRHRGAGARRAGARGAARAEVESALGGKVEGLKPGSPQAMELKKLLQQKGLWSQYLEVGIGPDAEIFTKCQVLAAVGTGMSIGVLAVLDLEQSRARGRGRRHLERQDRRRDARQRREPARRRRPLGAAALEGEGQQRLDGDRPVRPPVRQDLLARRSAPHARVAHREGHGGLHARRIERCRQDQPRPAGPRRAR